MGKTDGDFYILLSTERYPPARGEDPSKSVVRFPVTKVPVSATVALHSKVLYDLHGRMSSGPPQPYFVEILRRGDNTAARGAIGTTLPFLRTAEPRLGGVKPWGSIWEQKTSTDARGDGGGDEIQLSGRR